MANNDYINRKHVKELALRFARDKRIGWQPTRVSKQFLDDLNIKVQNMVTKAVMSHRSVGRTIKDIL